MVEFNHLSKTEFEELCYDIIKAKGFTNIDWRKGTGKLSSPSDNSRDIEADKIITDIDNSTCLLRYFFECKHFKSGVPPTEIEGALTWAEAERPYCLVIIASYFLSNPCKSFIDKYKENNKPKFLIKTWENKTLELLLKDEKDLCLKWKINIQDMSYKYINKYHLEYSTKSHLNTLEYLLDILDNYDIDIKDTLLECIYNSLPIRFSLSKKEKYEEFKEFILKTEFSKSPIFTHQLITEVLAWAYHMGDLAEKDITRNNLMGFQNFLIEKYGTEDSAAKRLTDDLNMLDERIDRYYRYYNDFCNNIVFDLLSEPVIPKIIKKLNL